MPTTPTNDPENALVDEIIKLNRTLRRANSWWRAFLRGILTSIGTVVGVVIITGVIGAVLFHAAQGVNWNDVVQSAILRAIGGGSNTRTR